MEQSISTSHIAFGELWKKILSKKRMFFILWVVTFVLSSFYILCVPRYYITNVKLAPELGGEMGLGGALGGIASSFGFNLGEMQSGDAIYPTLYPDLMEDNAFVTRMFDVHVKSADGEIDTDYYTYLRKHQKAPWWSKATSWLSKKLTFKKKKNGAGSESTFDPYHLSEDDNNVANAIRGNITISFNEKTGVILINTRAQDPLICKTLADTMQVYLQKYITEYRTKKSRVDADHYAELCKESFAEYDKARRTYAAYADANSNAIRLDIATRISDLENDMQQKYNNYTAFQTQYQVANSKVQERTPAFTTIKGAEVPVRHAGPKRMLFVALMLILATMAAIGIILRHDISKIIVVKQQ